MSLRDIEERVSSVTRSFIFHVAARRFRTKKIPQLGNQTALVWLVDFFQGFENEAPGLLQEEIKKGTTFMDLLPEIYKDIAMDDSLKGSKIANMLTSDEAAEIVHSGIAELNPEIAEICTLEWFALSFENYKQLNSVD